jgi:hypothetical protein
MRKLPPEIQAEYESLSERLRISKSAWRSEHGSDRPNWDVTNQQAYSLQMAIAHLIMPYRVPMGPPKPLGPLTELQKENLGKTKKQRQKDAMARAIKQLNSC